MRIRTEDENWKGGIECRNENKNEDKNWNGGIECRNEDRNEDENWNGGIQCRNEAGIIYRLTDSMVFRISPFTQNDFQVA